MAYKHRRLQNYSPAKCKRQGRPGNSPGSFGDTAQAGHEEVRLSREEMDKLACGIDLAIPYCGDYAEANLWTEANMQNYNSRVAERRRLNYLQKRKTL